MSRYFFNLHENGVIIPDSRGECFPSAEGAKEHALQVAYELSRNKATRGGAKPALAIIDEIGTVIMRVPLRGASALQRRRDVRRRYKLLKQSSRNEERGARIQ
jgi:hypothetical protein